MSTPRRSQEARIAESSASVTFSFHGDGMNLVASTTSSRPGRPSSSRASNRPMMRSLSPLPYTSAVSKNVAPATTLASHASAMVPSVSAES